MRYSQSRIPRGGKPTTPYASDYSMGITNRPFRAFSSLKPITLYVEPTEQAAEAPTEYKFINRTNKVTEANYTGKLNSSGNVMDILPNSQSSVAVDYIDCGDMQLKLKYQYLAIDGSDQNSAANIQMTKSINEALARVTSDSYTDLPFFADYHESSMPNCNSSADPSVYRQYLATMVFYQTFLQNTGLIISRYQFLLAMEKQMLHMGFNRESANIVDLMGRFKKNAFRSKVLALRTTIMSNYFDKAWWRQVGTLLSNASRKCDAIREPILFIDGYNQMPDLQIYTDPSDKVKYKVLAASDFNVTLPAGMPTILGYTGGQTVTYDQLTLILVHLMNPYSIIKWARQVTFGTAEMNATEYHNLVNSLLDLAMAKQGAFSAKTADIKTMLDVANRAGINKWELGVVLDIDTKAEYEVTFFKLIHDLYRSTFATTHDIEFDSKTQRWSFKSLWDEYMGIPEYDKINGGAFLLFSCHDAASQFPSTDIRNLVPQMFEAYKMNKCQFTDRFGEELQVYSHTFDWNDFTATNRLKLVADPDFDEIIVPFVDLYDHGTIEKSCALYLLQTLFGYGAWTDRNPATVDNSHPWLKTDLHDLQVHASLVGFIDVELADVSNDMIAYYQTYAPLVVYSSTTERTMGFTDIPRFQ